MTVIVDARLSSSRARNLIEAHRVCGVLMAAVPEHIEIRTWKVEPASVKAQYTAHRRTDAQVRADIFELASMFGLAYDEQPHAGLVGGAFTEVNATGVIDGVDVEFWAHVDKAVAAA